MQTKKRESKTEVGKIINILLFAAVSLVFCILFSPYTSVLNKYYGIDTAQYQVIGEGILRGKLPYVDLFDHKGPMIFLIWALGRLLGHGTKWGIFLLQIISMTAGMVFLHKLLNQMKVEKVKQLFVFLVFLFILCGTIVEGGLTEEWAIPCLIYSIYIAYEYTDDKLKHSLWVYAIIVGIMFAYVAWMRLNNAIGIGIVVLFLSIYLIKRRNFKELFRCGLGFIVGVMVVSLPLIVWFAVNGALDALFYASIQYNYLYATNGFWNKNLYSWLKIVLYEGFTLFALIWSGFSARRRLCESGDLRWKYLLGFLLVLFCGVNCALGYTWQHYFMLFIPAIMYVLGLVSTELNLKKLILCFIVIILPYSWQSARNIGKNLLFIGFDYYGHQQNEIARISEIIPDEEKDSVWTIEWCSSKWFAINDMLPCYKVFDFPSVLVSKELYDDTKEMLENNPPKWILRKIDAPDYIEGYSEWLEENYSIKDYVIYQSKKKTDAPEELTIEIWKRD